ncbi:MAG: hypothetical protein ABI200_05755 [Gaiellales bacterium]
MGRNVEENPLVARSTTPHTPELLEHRSMQRRTHAAIGAWSLGTARPAAWGDSRRSIELVGTATGQHGEDATAAPIDIFAAGEQLVTAARSWLAEPAQQAALTPQVIDDASKTIEIAMGHFRELDLLAGEVARDIAAAGSVDPTQVEQVGLMASTLETYATRLRALLDPATVQLPEAGQRLQTALAASGHGGGLPALVAAL